eukprot:scaffold8123_cov66-Phaeocystis_antarctica.AAC.8
MEPNDTQALQSPVECELDLELLAVLRAAHELRPVGVGVLVVHARPAAVRLAAKGPEAVQIERSAADGESKEHGNQPGGRLRAVQLLVARVAVRLQLAAHRAHRVCWVELAKGGELLLEGRRPVGGVGAREEAANVQLAGLAQQPVVLVAIDSGEEPRAVPCAQHPFLDGHVVEDTHAGVPAYLALKAHGRRVVQAPH